MKISLDAPEANSKEFSERVRELSILLVEIVKMAGQVPVLVTVKESYFVEQLQILTSLYGLTMVKSLLTLYVFTSITPYVKPDNRKKKNNAANNEGNFM
ncbi:MAG: hypothetical protein ACP5NW_00945 [Candidatus Woesearchaeota archaeon]